MSIPSELLKRKFRAAWPHLDERTRRIMAATEAVSLGYGGVSAVARSCGLSRKAMRVPSNTRQGTTLKPRRLRELATICERMRPIPKLHREGLEPSTR